MDQQLRKTRRINFDSTLVFGRLSLIVLIGNFYQFTLIQRRTLYSNLIDEKKVHNKSF